MKIVLSLLLASVFGYALASGQSYSVVWDLNTHRTVTGLSFSPAPIVHDILGLKGFDATPVILGGLDQYGSGAIGGELAFSVPVAREYSLDFGVGGVAIAGSKSHLLVSLGIARRF